MSYVELLQLPSTQSTSRTQQGRPGGDLKATWVPDAVPGPLNTDVNDVGSTTHILEFFWSREVTHFNDSINLDGINYLQARPSLFRKQFTARINHSQTKKSQPMSHYENNAQTSGDQEQKQFVPFLHSALRGICV